MNYAQSILWLILSALCMAQCVAKLRKPDVYVPVNFKYDSHDSHSFAEFMSKVEKEYSFCKTDRTIERISSPETKFQWFEMDAPYVLKAGETFAPEFNPITTEIKINGAVVRKGKPKP